MHCLYVSSSLHHETAPLCAALAASATERAAGAERVPSNSPAPPGTPNRAFQLERWAWDVFICHAGEDKAFGRCLHRRLVRIGLRSFLDEESLRVGGDAPAAMEAAVHSSQLAVVLLSEEFFRKPCPKQELRWFLQGHTASRSTVVPVFLGVTVERCGAQRPAVSHLCWLLSSKGFYRYVTESDGGRLGENGMQPA